MSALYFDNASKQKKYDVGIYQKVKDTIFSKYAYVYMKITNWVVCVILIYMYEDHKSVNTADSRKEG